MKMDGIWVIRVVVLKPSKPDHGQIGSFDAIIAFAYVMNSIVDRTDTLVYVMLSPISTQISKRCFQQIITHQLIGFDELISIYSFILSDFRSIVAL